VPDFLLFLLGVDLDTPDWETLKTTIRAKAGSSVAGKGAAFQIADAGDNTKIELLKLAEGSGEAEHLSKLHDAMALSICSSNRVPPLLAGITLAGKQGAANETVQALILFERQVVRAYRRLISRKLHRTIGHPELGVEQLKGEKFHFASMLDQLDMFAFDTMARSKDEAAKQPDRDFSQGTLKRGRAAS
jgi:hypothetical protein